MTEPPPEEIDAMLARAKAASAANSVPRGAPHARRRPNALWPSWPVSVALVLVVGAAVGFVAWLLLVDVTVFDLTK